MCGSMADIQSAAAEIRRGKKEEGRRRRTNQSMKIYMVSLLHRATINNYFSPESSKYIGPNRKSERIGFVEWAIK